MNVTVKEKERESMDVNERGTVGDETCPPRLTLAMVADGVLAPAHLHVEWFLRRSLPTLAIKAANAPVIVPGAAWAVRVLVLRQTGGTVPRVVWTRERLCSSLPALLLKDGTPTLPCTIICLLPCHRTLSALTEVVLWLQVLLLVEERLRLSRPSVTSFCNP